MENSSIKVSVIMPVYNSGEYLKTAVESILNQSLREIELIIVDDGSTDGSAEHCDEYACKDSRVRVIHQKNSGICAARNAGLKVVRGEYIGFSDHDDEYGEGQLEDNYKLIREAGSDIIKFGRREIITVGGSVIRNVQSHFGNVVYQKKDIRNEFWKIWSWKILDCVWDALFSRKFLTEHNICFNPYYRAGGEDFDFLWHCIGQEASLRINNKIYYTHYLRIRFSTSMKYNAYNEKMTVERPQMLLNLISPLNIKPENHKVEYAYWWLQVVLGSLCHTLAHPSCKLTCKEKIKVIKGLKEVKSFRKWILNDIKSSELKKIASKKYVLLKYLYRFHFYGVCLKLYEFQYFKNKIK